MIFTDALKAMAAGHIIRRPGGVMVEIQVSVVPLLVESLMGSVGGPAPLGTEGQGNWIFTRFPCISHHPDNVLFGYYSPGAPYAFGPDEVNANNWELVPKPPQE